jgi:hypothetical protein
VAGGVTGTGISMIVARNPRSDVPEAGFAKGSHRHGVVPLRTMAKAEATAEELVATSHHMREALGTGAGHAWDPERRWRLRVELEAIILHKCGLARDDAAYVMDTSPIVKRRDEQVQRIFRTKAAINTVYNELAACEAAGHAYVPPIDPASGH